MCRVLIIDDEETICNMLLYAFSRNGIEAKIATNGREGLERFNQEYFDLVITDMMMPGVNGNSVARQIQQFHSLRRQREMDKMPSAENSTTA